jgi:hypothetical protein
MKLRWVAVALVVALAGCQVPSVGLPYDVPEPVPCRVLIAVGAGGSIARLVVSGETVMGNPNLPSSKILQGNYVFGGNVQVLGSFNQGSQQNAVNSALAAGQIANGVGNSVAFAGDLFAKGTLYQAFGSRWTPVANNFGGNAIFAITYASGNFIAGGQASGVANIEYSTDNGKTWNNVASNPFGIGNIFQMASGLVSGTMTTVAVGDNAVNPAAAYSINGGVTWSALVTAGFVAGNQLTCVTYGNGVFLAGDNHGNTYRSTNGGASWTQIANPFPAVKVFGLAYGAGIFIASVWNGTIGRSTDYGLTWSLITGSDNPFVGTDNLAGVSYGNGVFVIGSGSAKLARSLNLGVSWTIVDTNVAVSVAYNYGIFQAGILGGGTIRSYDNGVTWTTFSTGFSATVRGIASNLLQDKTGTMVAVGDAGSIATAGWVGGYNFAPLPQTAAGVGQVVPLNPALAAALVAPANGLWEVDYYELTGAGAMFALPSAQVAFVAGGTTVQPGIGGVYWSGWARRIA